MMASEKEKLFTLVFVKNENGGNPQILLGLKKKGFDQGMWNGFGGKVEINESILEGALRELREECGLTGELKKLGVLHFHGREEETILVVHVLHTYSYNGAIIESEEMQPKWFGIKEIPFGEMKEDARFWFDHMLKGKFFKGYFRYENDRVIDHNIDELTKLEEN
ncbi:7,8-dihydro-8-oxoguanine triphosphatase-like [Leptopilina heterotoma]|uniref:7,8-dihydro-8-oxoguanine triphosphatase-like n=1 Tax=Leptopilina heterotoma TaxID=63436 RepID=UPI001CA89F9E|nr:7,8-dihydro-8-oxoguanine triphosphatase-like [Leptopilina heterotoma]XP_043466634.1 7,8-dihydro-8-oxoguanine triphosphatase-like [Leptopilina heterotoma]